MQTSAGRRRNVLARGKGVVRWLPWIAEMLHDLGLLGELPHAAAVPGLRAEWPVQIRQNLGDDKLWYVVANSGTWGNTGFTTAELATDFARKIVIADDGTEYRRNPNGEQARHFRRQVDMPSGLTPEQLRKEIAAKYGKQLALPVVRRITDLEARYDALIEEIDRAYALGHHRKALRLEPEAERLRTALTALHEEYDQGGEEADEPELETPLEVAFAHTHQDYLMGRFGRPGAVFEQREPDGSITTETTEDRYAANLRDQLVTMIWMDPPEGRREVVATDDQLRLYATAAWERRERHKEMLRRARESGGESEVERVKAWMRRQQRERRNPIFAEQAHRHDDPAVHFERGELRFTVTDEPVNGAEEIRQRGAQARAYPTVIQQYVAIELWATLAALNRVVEPGRLALFLKYHDEQTHPKLFSGDWVRVGMLTLAEFTNAPRLMQIGVADVPLEFRQLGLGIYLYSIAVDVASDRGMWLASLPHERSDEATDVWNSRRFRRYAEIEEREADHPYMPQVALFQTARRANPRKRKRVAKKKKKPAKRKARGLPAGKRKRAKKKAAKPKPKPKVDPKAHLRTVTPEQQAQAAQMLKELREMKLLVEKQKAIEPETKAEGFVLVAVERSPEWYSEFVSRRAYTDPKKYRPKKKPRTPGYRAKVFAALQRIIDNRPYPTEDWIGWELLELESDLQREAREEARRMGFDIDSPEYQEYERQLIEKQRAEEEDDVPF